MGVRGVRGQQGSQPPLGGKSLGDRVKAAYRAAGFNRHSFSREIGVSYTTVIAWEKNESVPMAHNLRSVAKTTGYTVDDLLGATVEPETGRRPRGKAAGLREFEASELAAFLQTKVGETSTPSEVAELRAINVSGVATRDTYQFLLLALRATCSEDEAWGTIELEEEWGDADPDDHEP